MNPMTMPRRLPLFCLLALGAASAGTGCAPSLAQQQSDSAFRARTQLTRELVARSEWNGAFAYADDLHRQRPEDAEVLTLRGIIYRERNLPGEAEADLRAAVSADERSAEAHAALGILLDSSSRGVEAEKHHRRAVELAPGKAMYLNNLGFSLLVRRRHKDAVPVMERAARLDPTNHRIRTNLGFAHAAAGDMVRASREFEMGGTPSEGRNNLGYAYEQRGDLRNAFELYAEALRLDRHAGRARHNLVHVARRLGREIPADLAETSAAAAVPALPLAVDPNRQETRP
jgi:Flp pilus assembly protein TadD